MLDLHFIESIRLVDGIPQLLSYHKKRIRQTLYAHSAKEFFSLDEYVHSLIEQSKGDLRGVYKLRFEYSLSELRNPSLIKYEPKIIKHLYPYPIDNISCYRYKYCNRSALDIHLTDITSQMYASSLPIFSYKGLLTDTPYSNIVLDMGDGIWHTPAQPLLNGVMRQFLIDEGYVTETSLTEDDLFRCHQFRLINALLPLSALSPSSL